MWISEKKYNDLLNRISNLESCVAQDNRRHEAQKQINKSVTDKFFELDYNLSHPPKYKVGQITKHGECTDIKIISHEGFDIKNSMPGNYIRTTITKREYKFTKGSIKTIIIE